MVEKVLGDRGANQGPQTLFGNTLNNRIIVYLLIITLFYCFKFCLRFSDPLYRVAISSAQGSIVISLLFLILHYFMLILLARLLSSSAGESV